MTPEEFDAAALALPATAVDIKWGSDRCYTVGGKIFAVIGPEPSGGAEGFPAPRYSFKCSDGSFEQLIAEGVAQPAPYAARFKWVQLKSPDALPDEQLRRYLEIAHSLVAAKLTRKARAELGLA